MGWKLTKKKNHFSQDMFIWENNKTIIEVWRDWEGYWNVYYSRYPYDDDKRIYRGKSKTKALAYAKKWMKAHPNG